MDGVLLHQCCEGPWYGRPPRALRTAARQTWSISNARMSEPQGSQSSGPPLHRA
jgi:hypothetical protein